MSAAAGAVLGPRPGLAIVSFSQGIVEIILRVVAIVVSILIGPNYPCTFYGYSFEYIASESLVQIIHAWTIAVNFSL